MGILDTLTSLIGVGILGYFAYTVILPKALELRAALPQLYAPGSQQQQPAAAATPVAAPPQVSAQDEVEALEEEILEKPAAARRSTTTPSAAASAPASSSGGGGGSIIYDSSKGWSGVTTAASGNPKWSAQSGGVGTLSCGSGHCRVYIAIKNHNARMEGEYMYTGSVDNISLRLRSRHNEGGSCENRFGGFGTAIQKSGEVEFQTESCHNNHENSSSGRNPSGAPQANKWYRFAYSVWDSADKKSVNFKLDIDGKTALTGKHASPKPYYMDENLHNQKSYIWIRSNNSGSGTISVRNFKVYNLGKGGATANANIAMATQPYMYNRFYHGRRM